MKRKTRKCQWCGEQGDLDNMIVEMVGKTKPVRKFYHSTCHVKFLEDKAFKEKEQKEKDELNEVLKQIYGVKEIPKQAWTMLESLRGGNPVFGKKQQIGKRYKQGYTYPLIRETFEHCSETIEYWNGVKSFEGFMSAFKYALAIIIDKIYFVEQRAVEREKKKELMDKHVEEVNHEVAFESSYQKSSNKNTTDISEFLDD